MKKIIDNIKKLTGNSIDFIYKEIDVLGKPITLVFSEALISSSYINDFILKNISSYIKNNNTCSLINTIPSTNIKKIQESDISFYLYQAFTILIMDKDNIYAIETRIQLDSGINESKTEVTINGPNDAFSENFNTNLGLIRKRIRSNNLYAESVNLGKESHTKVGLCYMKNICNDKLIQDIKVKLNKIKIDAIIDSNYIKEFLTSNNNFFPVIKTTERPDTVCQALLEGKAVIISDNSNLVIIVPSFFIDFFHTSDDYYQRPVNVTFIRIVRLIAFFIAIFLPSYYVSITTHNQSALSLFLLQNFIYQRLSVPFPAFVEAIIMILCFEILKESDNRTPSKVGTSVSILGGLILGEAGVSAGIISPIMIIIIAISSISGLLFSTSSLNYSIRYLRLISLFLAIFFGLFGLFISLLLLIIIISSINTFTYPYTAPIAPLTEEIYDSIIKRNKPQKKRNPLLAKKNPIKGENYEKN